MSCENVKAIPNLQKQETVIRTCGVVIVLFD